MAPGTFRAASNSEMVTVVRAEGPRRLPVRWIASEQPDFTRKELFQQSFFNLSCFGFAMGWMEDFDVHMRKFEGWLEDQHFGIQYFVYAIAIWLAVRPLYKMMKSDIEKFNKRD